MYVCIVMNFYETGDLDFVLKQQRSKEQPLPEQILKKWVGQVIEALHFVHSKKVRPMVEPKNMKSRLYGIPSSPSRVDFVSICRPADLPSP